MIPKQDEILSSPACIWKDVVVAGSKNRRYWSTKQAPCYLSQQKHNIFYKSLQHTPLWLMEDRKLPSGSVKMSAHSGPKKQKPKKPTNFATFFMATHQDPWDKGFFIYPISDTFWFLFLRFLVLKELQKKRKSQYLKMG